MKIPDKFQKPYKAKEIEDEIYKKWEESGLFNPDNCIKKGFTDPEAKTFSMVLPPPNVTGVLHIGHAYESALQDVIVRFERMSGKKTLWIPGTDHAAIATQSKVEKKIYEEEGKSRHDLGREKFLKMVEDFALASQKTILNQLKRMGVSLDWSRLAFTLDEKREEAVYEAFKRMYEAGLIYRGDRIVNWDPRLGTTVSDDEVERVEEKTNFYYLKYGPFTIATARPETKFGDKYVVMHPEDERYAEYEHGQEIELEWINGPITATVIKDEAIDMEFGTGVMTITPAHDATDFEIAKRHNLDYKKIIDLKGRLLPVAEEFEGMHISKARPRIVEKLKEKGLLVKVDENYTHMAAVNSRGGEKIEPQIMKQWFVDVEKKFTLKESKIKGIESGSKVTLKEIMKKTVESGEITITPEQFEKRYFHWVENLHDWCISRQIWFGHRIPVWYRSTDAHGRQEVKISKESPGDEWEQDPDTLDTWFSSGLWTFSTLGWPQDAKDLEDFHPTDIIDPGYEILFLWVSRMIFLSGFLLGEIPFKTALMHGIVRDKKGRKFSKSSGIGGDPLEVIEEYGADALRMSLIVGVAIGNDPTFDMDKVKAYKHFANKIWNASRFVLENLPDDFDYEKKPDKFSSSNKKHLKELEETVKDATENIENFMFHLAAEDLYHYFWHSFADIIIEENKDALFGDSTEEKRESAWLLYHILRTSLILLHPFMPFITEEIWSHLPGEENLLMVEKWPR